MNNNSKTRQIIAMGGGGFTMEPGNPLLDEYVLSQSPGKNPRICFLPTASNDNSEYIRDFYAYFTTRACQPSHLSLTEPHTSNFESYLLDQDIIYVGGGNTGRMLALWKKYSLDVILKKAWDQGILLAGVSAGAACWFEQALTDSIPGKLTGEKCLGFLKGSYCAHYDNTGRRPTFHRFIRTRELQNGIGVDNFAALHLVNRQVKKVVSSRPDAAAYTVRKEGKQTLEKPMKSLYLGTP
ncbi:MAG: peptidase E [Candidatus Aminicenantes bacterium]|nr:MAG: peptidase E [Candidatus Aminicenantes bacterium]